MSSQYVRDDHEYKRSVLTIKDAAYEQYLEYIMSKGKTRQEAEDVLFNLIPAETPTIVRYNRINGEDKHIEKVPLDTHIQQVTQDNVVLTPTFTGYLPKSTVLSFHSDLITKRLAWRTKVKQDMFDAETQNLVQEAEYQGLLQVAIKTGNNSVSGVYGIESTAIGNKTAHSSLTSCTRVATNTSNIALERLLSGTLMLLHPDSATHYACALVTEYKRKMEVIDAAFAAGNLYLPTVDDVYMYLLDNTRRYTSSLTHIQRLKAYLSTLHPNALAFIMYAGNLFNIDKYNPEYVRGCINKMLTPAPLDQYDRKLAISSIKRSNDNVVNAAHHLLLVELNHKGNNYYKMADEDLNLVTAECYKLHGVIHEYSDCLYPLLTVDTQPPNLAYTKQMTRYTIVGSDTDSNLITFMNWCNKYNGHKYPTLDNMKLTGVLGIFAGMMTEDVLRQLSVNFGVDMSDINRIEMKSEYTPSSIALVGLTKTYFQTIVIKEKSVLPDPYLIIKGVHLKSSALPPAISSAAKKMMMGICTTLISGTPVSINQLLEQIIAVEREVIESIFKGERKFLRLLKINPAENYKDKNVLKNNAGWAEFWSDELHIELPSSFVKLPTNMDNKTKLNLWLQTLPEAKLKHVTKWLNARGKKDLPTIYIPEDYVKAHHVPDWIKPVVDVHKIVSDVCNIFYIILISLGYTKQKTLMLLEDLGQTVV